MNFGKIKSDFEFKRVIKLKRGQYCSVQCHLKIHLKCFQKQANNNRGFTMRSIFFLIPFLCLSLSSTKKFFLKSKQGKHFLETRTQTNEAKPEQREDEYGDEYEDDYGLPGLPALPNLPGMPSWMRGAAMGSRQIGSRSSYSYFIILYNFLR